jgi:hypothetical protein
MAVLTNTDYQKIKKFIRNDSTAKAEFKAWGLDKQTWKNVFQEAEDWFVDGFTSTPLTSFKAALEVEAGASTNTQIKQTAYAWMCWRVKVKP